MKLLKTFLDASALNKIGEAATKSGAVSYVMYDLCRIGVAFVHALV